jgi:DNA-binding NarL/FixJ family response regulator
MTQIAICEAHPAVALGLSRLLEDVRSQFTVVGVANSGRQIRTLVADKRPDIVLMDIFLPDTSGIAATRQIRSEFPETQVVILTVSDRVEDLREAIDAGASAFVMKTAGLDEIVTAIDLVHKGYSLMPTDLVARLPRDSVSELGPVTLSFEEGRILMELADGKTYKAIAIGERLSERTVRRRVRGIYSKLHVTGRIQAVLAMRLDPWKARLKSALESKTQVGPRK